MFVSLYVGNHNAGTRDASAGEDRAGAAHQVDGDWRVRAGLNSRAVNNSRGTSERDGAEVGEGDEGVPGSEILNNPLGGSTLDLPVSL